MYICRTTMTQNDTTTETFDFESLTAGDHVRVTVEASNGDLMQDEKWVDEIEFVGQQNLSAQSRSMSWEFRHPENGQVYIRHTKQHENNFGFIKTREDKSDVDYDAMWQDVISDDREWKVISIEIVD